MYLAGVQKPALQPARVSYGAPMQNAGSAFRPSAPPPAGMRFSKTGTPSLTNAEMRAVTEWRFGTRKTPHTVATERYSALKSRGLPYAQIMTTLRNEGLYDAFVHL